MGRKNKNNYLKFLTTLKGLKSDQRNALMSYLNDDAIDDLCECVYNVLYTDLGMSKKTQNNLKKHIKKNCCKKSLRTITDRNVSILKRKKALEQEGGNIFMLIARALPFIANAIGGLFSK